MNLIRSVGEMSAAGSFYRKEDCESAAETIKSDSARYWDLLNVNRIGPHVSAGKKKEKATEEDIIKCLAKRFMGRFQEIIKGMAFKK